MKSGKLLQILKSLNSEEWKTLKKAVRSPIFNTNPTVVQLFDLLRKRVSGMRGSAGEKEQIFAKLFPGDKYNDLKMRRLFTELTRIVEHFLVYIRLEKEKFQRNQLLAEAYGNRNLYYLFEKEGQKLLNQLEENPIKNAEYYLSRFKIMNALFFHPQHNNYDYSDTTLQELTDSVDSFFALMKMQLGTALKTQMKLFKREHTFRFSEALNDEANVGFLSNIPLFRLYKEGFAFLDLDKKVNFENYEKLLFDQLDNLGFHDQRVLFYNGVNYAVRQSNIGNKRFAQTVFRWYRIGLEKGLVLQHGHLSDTSFANIILYGCRQREFVWVEKFINQYCQYLNENTREEEVQLARVVLNFYKEDFDFVIAQLTDYPFSVPYILRTRSILTRTYFELFIRDSRYFDLLISYINSFEHYLTLNKIFTTARVESNLNFIRIIKGAAKRINNEKDLTAVKNYIVREIKERKRLVSKHWLVERFELQL